MATPKLFQPITYRNCTLKNRIVVSPMCMYAVEEEDGKATTFHVSHYESRAIGQAGLVFVESTAVTPEGRISNNDLGIWSDEHVEGLHTISSRIQAHGAKSGIQLGHAGRKSRASDPIAAPSNVPWDGESAEPTPLTIDKIKELVEAYRQAALRAKEAGFDVIEIHAAHGYLINQFLSPLTNKRIDMYGGARENRYRFLREVIDAVRQVWDGPLFVRISANEYAEDGNDMNAFIYYSIEMKRQGVDLIDCSTGGVVAQGPDIVYPGYQVVHAERIRKHALVDTAAVGLITNGPLAEEILQNGRADLVFVARAMLRNPYWPLEAAEQLHYSLEAPAPYKRGW
ncbi:NADPH dehydrogenase NamA [Terribacillus sp. DMT04]|uniref:NADPH dehydrogenase NamA n=1 Tax=Terribacillus sp. DMT04 TaxID=2850441 RepID=UPI001C2C2D77|nr:NADPH dehydrogenase NamA [Terribacillus sp. DMT04]QXE00343.1 NADPH dehydrogenase NamA [Terribacillus sp. DMT04]